MYMNVVKISNIVQGMQKIRCKNWSTPTTKEHVRFSLIDLLDKFSYFTTSKELKD